MGILNYERIAIASFEEQTVLDNTVYYTDIISMNGFDKVNFHITSSGTVDGLFTLETRSRPAPEVGTWANQDDGYWATSLITISGAKGWGVKQKDSVHLSNVDAAQVRLKMSITSGGTLAVHTTVK